MGAQRERRNSAWTETNRGSLKRFIRFQAAFFWGEAMRLPAPVCRAV
ncbi:hypothetical protein [Kingella sp. (in: b-proteobacteria)]|nr:hypothetical protein [Kingella sp. (in: b-proteobacteria)]MDO4656833.1 hypothetical protein [Kingella sp. (in: b-proteobacteria)]